MDINGKDIINQKIKRDIELYQQIFKYPSAKYQDSKTNRNGWDKYSPITQIPKYAQE